MLAASWPEVAELRRAASAPNHSRLLLAVAHLASATRIEMAAALLAAQSLSSSAPDRDCDELRATVATGERRHGLASRLVVLGADSLAESWSWTAEQTNLLLSNLGQLVGNGRAERPAFVDSPAARALDLAGGIHLDFFPGGPALFLSSLALGWPWELAIRVFSSAGAGMASEDCRTFRPGGALLHPSHAISTKILLGAAVIDLTIADDRIILVKSSSRLCPPRSASGSGTRMVASARPGRPWFPSNWGPEWLRIPPGPDGVLRLPKQQVGDLFDARHNWERLVGPLSGEARAVLGGYMQYPRVSHEVQVSNRPNHPSFNDDAKRILGPKYAAWLYSGVLEWSGPRDPPPSLIEPMGAVPKNGDPHLRGINDGRVGNKSLAHWPVTYTTALEHSWDVEYGDISSVSDVVEAYHTTSKGGCSGQRRRVRMPSLTDTGSRTWTWHTRIGCTPSSCSGTCDKARAGVSLDGMLARFASSHFGEAPAGSPLNVLMMTIRRYFARRGPFACDRRVATAAWVDDLVLLLKNLFHGFCGGLDAGCSLCADLLALAVQLEAHWMALAPQLAVPLCDIKRQSPGQRYEYAGIIYHTIRGLFLIPDRKLLKVTESIEALVSVRASTARAISAVAGRLLHYSLCIKHVRPFVPAFWAAIGCEGEPEYDREVIITDQIRSVCAHLLSVIPQYAAIGSTLWPFVPSSLYAAFLRGDALGIRLRVIDFDASQIGWGFGIRSPEDATIKIHPNSWPRGTDSSVQVHNEGAAAPLALAAAELMVSMQDSVVIFRNDSLVALSALRKGCTSSPALQSSAMSLSRSCARLNADPLFLHVPGSSLVAEGIDDASRALVSAERGPACGPALRARIRDLATSHGWNISLDLFACAENALTARYYSLHPEPHAEAVDALSVPDWNCSQCPACGLLHRNIIFAFPPAALIPSFMAKAAADEICGIVALATAITSPHWNKLLRASLDKTAPGYIRIRHPSRLLEHAGTFRPSELALFTVDFQTRRADRRSMAPACSASLLARRRPTPLFGHPDPATAAVRSALQRALRSPPDT